MVCQKDTLLSLLPLEKQVYTALALKDAFISLLLFKLTRFIKEQLSADSSCRIQVHYHRLELESQGYDPGPPDQASVPEQRCTCAWEVTAPNGSDKRGGQPSDNDRLPFFPGASMAEDWQDCPALGPGWKRREAFRKSGASCGRSDIYYQRCCENCGIHLSWDSVKRQRLKALCKDCRAQRIAFNREQRMFRRVGCGECTACLVKEDCGACSICRLQLPHDVASELFCKCERRRCLRIVEKGKRDHRKSGSKVAAQHHSQAQPLPPLPASQHPEPTELHISDLAPTSPAEFIYYCVDEDELQPYTNHRQNRKCGACAACLRRMDCGHCDFCCDKPKFGGSNQKRQKCRWRQCLQFAMKRLLPSTGSGSEEGAGLPPCHPCRKRPGSPQRLHLGSSSEAPLAMLTTPPGPAQVSAKQQTGRGLVLSSPDAEFVFIQAGTGRPVQVPGPAAASSEAPLQEAQCSAQSWVVAMPQVKQEKMDAPEEWTAGTAFLTSSTVQDGCPGKAGDPELPPVKQEPPGPEEDREENREDYVSESIPEEEAGGVGTPVRAKPSNAQRAEQHLKRIQHNYHKYHTTLASIKSKEQDRLRTDWIQHNDRKYFDSLVQSRVKDAMQGFIINTEERRNKLRELLASEENEYFTEMQLKGETIEEKKERMRERTKLLREKKEKERQHFVAEKLEQQFREGCEELRNKLVSIHELKVSEERKAQVAFNEELKRRNLVEEQMYARLWEEDRLAKEQREAHEERRQKALVENTRMGLDAQVTSIKAQREAARRMRDEEARFLEESNAQAKLEKEQEKLQKQKTKKETRNILQKAVQEKLESMQQEHREERDLNMKLVGRALQDLQEEADKKQQKREDMRREQKMYNDYLKQRRMEEKAQEQELDRVLEDMKAKTLAEKDRELAIEREARKRLLNEVMCTRKLQVQEKLQRKLKEQEELAMQQERINEGLKELNCAERENFARRCDLAKEYRNQLRMQIAYQQQALEAEKEEQRQEFEAGLAANKACLDKIQEMLSEHPALSQNVHPMRRACPDKPPR
ncbi:hypothetical protein STEG23_024175 [Scotinomys teguina]